MHGTRPTELAAFAGDGRRAEDAGFRRLVSDLPESLVRYDADGRIVFVNRHFEMRTGRSAASVIGYRPFEWADHQDLVPDEAEYRASLASVLATGEPVDLIRTRVDPSGEQEIFQVSFRPEFDDDERVVGAYALARNVSDLVRAREQVVELERDFQRLAENADDCIARWLPDGRRVFVNPVLAALTGLSPDELIGTTTPDAGPFAELAAAIRKCAAEATPLTVEQHFPDAANGGERTHEIRLVPEYNARGAVVSVLGIGRDVTEVVRQREELERAARHDALTGAHTRSVLYARVPEVIGERAADGGRCAVVLFDLDRFKNINDQHGHRFGDLILRSVVDAVTTVLEPDDFMVRLGGDEFVIVRPRVAGHEDAVELAERARSSLARIQAGEPRRMPAIDFSAGVALYPDHATDVDTLLAFADLALYDAKRSGRGSVAVFRTELRDAMEREAAIEQALVECDPDSEMTLHLQPICSIDTRRRVWGAEALLRWHHPRLGPVSPVEFVPIAERSGQIVPIGRWVLRRAAEYAVELNRDRDQPLQIAVNVSTRQFTLDDVVDLVERALAETGCDGRWLVLELTESLLLEDVPYVNRALIALHDMGVSIAIDDFGTGYSSLHYLNRLEVDHLKIDKAFLRDADHDPQQQEIVRALVAMAAALRLGIVAEGIETREQVELLNALGCHLGQGYLLARPMPFDDLRTWLRDADETVAASIGG